MEGNTAPRRSSNDDPVLPQESMPSSTPSCIDYSSFLKYMYYTSYKWSPTGEMNDTSVPTTFIGFGENTSGTSPKDFIESCNDTIPYFSYRNNFRHVLPNGSYHDAGWGCMPRVAQMMLGYCMEKHFARETRRTVKHRLVPGESNPTPRDLFRDLPSAPYGIHRMATEGENHGVPCGEWFTPTQLAKTIEAISQPFDGDLPHIVACVDRSIAVPEIRGVLRTGQAVIVLIPFMFGLKTVSELYEPIVMKWLDMTSCVGLIGGKKLAAVYMVGHQGDRVLIHDPHYVQSAYLSHETLGQTVGRIRTSTIKSLESSMLLCHYFDSESSFDQFQTEAKAIGSTIPFPVITFAQDAVANKGVQGDAVHAHDEGNDVRDEEVYATTEGEGGYAHVSHQQNSNNPLVPPSYPE